MKPETIDEKKVNDRHIRHSPVKKFILFLIVIILIYAIVWISVFMMCKFGIGSFEPCIWNLKNNWFPLPKCVCV